MRRGEGASKAQVKLRSGIGGRTARQKVPPRSSVHFSAAVVGEADREDYKVPMPAAPRGYMR